MENKKTDVAIIGSGISGITAALFCARQHLTVQIISIDIGGQLMMATDIHNYPGFTKISGSDLALKTLDQAQKYGIEQVYDEVKSIDKIGDSFRLTTDSIATYQADAVILASGKAPKELGIPGESALRGRGVSYCVVCDAPLYKGKSVAIYGWGHYILESLAVLCEYAEKVYWVLPNREPHEPEIISKFIGAGKLTVLSEVNPIQIEGKDKVEELIVRDKNGSRIELHVDGVFVEAGYVTKVQFLRGFVELNNNDEIVVDKACRTSRIGVFAAGDVTDMPFKQAIISAGMGATAALSAFSYLMEIKNRGIMIRHDWSHV